jgi:hypothetical protein
MRALPTLALWGRRSARVALAGLLLASLTRSAHAGAPTQFTVLRKIGEGGNQKAYRVSHDDPTLAHLNVLKIIKAQSTDRGIRHADAALRHVFAQEAVETARLLREAPEYMQRFGDVLVPSLLIEHEITVIKSGGPLVIPPRSGAVLQGEGHGVEYSTLSSPALKRIAQREVNAFADMAERLVPRSPVTGQPLRYSRNYRGNYLYDPVTGKISSTFDHISDAQRTAN